MSEKNQPSPGRLRKPPWLKVRAFGGESFNRVNSLLKSSKLNTVCQAANCPNRGECYSRGTATFMILGNLCTRNCGFCDVKAGRPSQPDPNEPIRVADAAYLLQLKHIVVTSVNRDDLPDGGAEQFAETIRQIRLKLSNSTVEVLIPDFEGNPDSLKIVLASQPDVLNHNIETVPELYSTVRPSANYERSLELLNRVSKQSTSIVKSGLMVGLGETVGELGRVFDDLSQAGVCSLTIGQYLAPSSKHLEVRKYWSPDEFKELKEAAQSRGIKNVFSAPLVRSSYRADQFLDV